MSLLVTYQLDLSLEEDLQFLIEKIEKMRPHPEPTGEVDDELGLMKRPAPPKMTASSGYVAHLPCGCRRTTDSLEKKKFIEGNPNCWKHGR